MVFYRLNILNALSHPSSALLLWPINSPYSELLSSPLIVLKDFLQLDDLIFEDFDLRGASALHIVDVGVHEGLNGVGAHVGAVQRLLNHIGRAVGVGAHDVSLNRLVLSVDQDLLPGRVRGVVDVVPAVNKDAVVVELLDFLDSREVSRSFPVVLFDEGFCNGDEGRVEGVAELEDGGGALAKFWVCKTHVYFVDFHFCFLFRGQCLKL